MSLDPARLGRSGPAFTKAAAEGRGALVGYLPVGYPNVPGSYAALRALVEGSQGRGVDVVEIGLPYSDPIMDGPVVERAGTLALERGVRTKDVFGAVEAVATTGVPALVMTYWNLVERYGIAAFARDLDAAGGAGLITPDLTPDEGAQWIAVADELGLDKVFLVSPSSTDDRIASTAAVSRGWLYATSVMGVTGTRTATSSAAPELVRRIRSLDSGIQVGVGLGVSNGDQAAEVTRFADGVIVGSALVRRLLDADAAGRPDDLTELRALVDELAAGVRREGLRPAAATAKA